MTDKVNLLFKDAHIEWAAKVGDDAMPLDEWIKGVFGKLAEQADNLLITWLLKLVNAKLSTVVNEHLPAIIDNVQIALDDCIDGDDNYSTAIDQLDQAGKDVLDITSLSPSAQNAILMGLQAIEFILNSLIERKQSQEEVAE